LTDIADLNVRLSGSQAGSEECGRIAAEKPGVRIHGHDTGPYRERLVLILRDVLSSSAPTDPVSACRVQSGPEVDQSAERQRHSPQGM
jgi:hypothetical protein